MPGTIVLRVLQPGDLADRLLEAVAQANDRSSLKPNDGPTTVGIWVEDVAQARAATEQALDAAGNEGQSVVRLLAARG